MATSFSKKEYTGPMSKRRVVDGKADVSKEELDDFKRKYGSDKTLRDLLNADRTGKLPEPVGAYRSRRAKADMDEPKKEAPKAVKAAPRASADKEEEEGGMSKRLRSAGLTAKGAEEAGGLGSSVLAALGMAGGAGANVARAAQAKKAVEASKAAAKEFSKGKAAQTTTDTGRRFTAKEEMEAATSAVKGAASRKTIQAARAKKEAEVAESTARGAASRKELAEKREQLAADYQKMLDKYASKKSSPRDRTREKAEFEFRKGGMAKKGKK